MAFPSFLRSLITWNSFSTSASVIADVGSSIMIISAFMEIAFAISTICASATLRSLSFRFGSSLIPIFSNIALQWESISFSSIQKPCANSFPINIFAETLRSGKELNS